MNLELSLNKNTHSEVVFVESKSDDHIMTTFDRTEKKNNTLDECEQQLRI